MPVTAGYSIADINALKAISTVDLVDGYTRKVISEKAWYMYLTTGTDTSDNLNIVTPNSNVGRWYRNKASVIPTDVPNLTEYIQDVVGSFIVQGSNVTVTYNDGANTLTIAANSSGYTNEEAQDAVGSILTDTTTIDFTYDDVNNQIRSDIKTNSLDDSHIKSDAAIQQSKINGLSSSLASKVNTSELEELVEDIVGTFLVQGSNIVLDYNDVSNTLSISATASSSGLGSWDELYGSVESNWDSEY